jgi:tetrapyrrole methylase family protein / MazG family protein
MNRACEEFNRLVEILDRLRGKDGCPWDKEQTSNSLLPYLLEETYEVMEAVEENDIEALKEELGDLMLHALFQAHIAKENGQFEIADSLQHISDKLIKRHPNVFGGEEVLEELSWESAKQKEKNRANFLDGVPKSLPALTRARRIQEKAADVGFDWTEIEPIIGKVNEEIDELKEAMETRDIDKIEDELGDAIFSIVNLGRFYNLSSEQALRRTIKKFETRFSAIEKELKKRGVSLDDASLEEMDEIWEAQKSSE